MLFVIISEQWPSCVCAPYHATVSTVEIIVIVKKMSSPTVDSIFDMLLSDVAAKQSIKQPGETRKLASVESRRSVQLGWPSNGKHDLYQKV